MRSVDGFFENLSLTTFSEIFIMKTTNNGLFIHQLKKQLKLVIFVRKPLLGEQKWTTPLLWKIYHFRKFLVFLHFKNQNNPHKPKILFYEQICGIEGRFKIVYFFFIHPVYAFTGIVYTDPATVYTFTRIQL